MNLKTLRTGMVLACALTAGACGGGRLADGEGGGVVLSACQVRAGAPGAEDFAPDWGSATLFVSSDDRRAQQRLRKNEVYPSGRILVLSADDPDPRQPVARVEAVDLPPVFHPHGLGLWVSPEGDRTLMAVNHPNWPSYEGSTIEIFDVGAGGGLKLRRTVTAPWLTRPNDVAPVGRDSFYVTIEGSARSGSLVDLAGLATGLDRSGSVWFFDGAAGRQVGLGLSFANSVALSSDGRRLFATSTVSGVLHVFTRDALTGSLSPDGVNKLGSGLDNIIVDPDGRLVIAAHPDLAAFVLGHARDAKARSPVRVLAVDSGAPIASREVFSSGGDMFSAASVAYMRQGRLILGAVYENGLMVCEADEQTRP
jgi:hypothetical protein